MWDHVSILFLIYGLASAQEVTPAQETSKANGANNASPSTGNPDLTPQNQNPLAYQNTLVPQQFNADQGFVNPTANLQPGGFFNENPFGGFNPLLGANNGLPLPQNLPPQQFPTSFKEIRVPQPYPVYINKPVPIQVPVRIPVEVPKPYPVRVPHPVPVPVQIRVPVPVEKPYPVPITRTVAIPVEKPVYIRVPHVLTEPVPHPYPNIPQNLSPEAFQRALGQFGQREIQIGGRLQGIPQQSEAREEGGVDVGVGVNPTPAINVNAYTTPNPNLLSGEVQRSQFGSSAPNSNGVQSNEVQTDSKPR